VVDDDRSMRRALRMQLRLVGFNVRTFESAESLLAGRFPTTNACLLLDIYMPGMTGFELCRALAAEQRQIPTVLMSGRDDEETRRLSKAQRLPCLFKPIDQAALLGAIQKAVRDRSESERKVDR
jgi:FixJ family two-component response regulator